jgi:hypothetical protein
MTPTTYNGRCHCGSVRFSFKSPPITAALRCNCSLCIRKGALMSTQYLLLESLEGQEAMAVYRWGDRLVNNWFCKTCGVYPFHNVTNDPQRYRVNLGCIDGLNPLDLPVTIVDGKAF